MANDKRQFIHPKRTPQIWLMVDVVFGVIVVTTENSQNPMNKKWKLAFTRRPAFPFRSFDGHEVRRGRRCRRGG